MATTRKFAAVMVALIIGGCGSATTKVTPGDPRAAGIAYAKCMRDHKIEGWPDPTLRPDGGVSVGDTSKVTAPETQVQAARTACQHILDENVPSRAPATGTGWQQTEPGGDCQCADGSEYSYYTRTADPTKVVLYLDGGGVCWSAATCAPGGDNRYQTKVEPPDDDGVFDAADQRNPFAGFSLVFVPYCTAVLHIGNAVITYAAGLTIHHRGYANGTAALDHLAKTFPHATEVVVIGASAGSVTAPLYAGWAADRLPKAHVTAIADSSGSYPDTPRIDSILRAWKAPGIGDHPSIPGFFIQAGREHPGIVFASLDHAADEDQQFHLKLTGVPADDLPALMHANEKRIERAGVTLHSFVAPGSEHIFVDAGRFYTESVRGITPAAWVARLISGRPTDDVHSS
jgi:hypothetical protein